MNKNNFPINQFFNANTIQNTKPNLPKNINISNFLELGEENQDVTSINSYSLDLSKIGEEVLSEVKKDIGEEKFKAIFNNVELVSIDNQSITFKTTSLIQKLFIKENYCNILKSHLIKHNLHNKEIIFTEEFNYQQKKEPIQQNKFSFKLESNNSASFIKKPSNIDTYISPFNEIIVSGFNKIAITSLRNISNNIGKKGKYPFIYLYGEPGVGKTQLLDATYKETIHNNPHLKVLKISSRTFVKDVISSYRNNKLEHFNHKYSESIDVLIIDEIQEFKNKEGSQNKFYHLFNDLFYKGKQIIVCSDQNPKSLDGFSDKLKSRLQWGLIIKIDKPDFETRVKILKDKSASMDLFLNDEVVNFLASYYKDSVRELEGAILSLSAYTEIMNVEIDLELAKEQLSIKQTEKLISLDEIANKCADFFNISMKDILSKSRKKDQVTARHIAWYLTREILNINLIDIAQFYNRKEHSSILHGVNKISLKLKSDANLSKTIFLIKTSL